VIEDDLCFRKRTREIDQVQTLAIA
jgi:hypothetical protein